MTRGLPCPAAPGPLEGYAARLAPCPGSLVPWEVREFPTGLLAQRDRNKAATDNEPVAGRVSGRRRLQFFL